MKTCTKCEEEKPLEEFPVNRRIKSGRSAQCKKCTAAKVREWAAKHPEKVNRKNRRWRKENPEKAHRLDRARRERDPGRVQRWVEANPEKRKAIRMRSDAQRSFQLIATDDGTVTSAFLRDLYETEHCFYCGQFTLAEDRQAEHKIPLARGGAHSASNLVMSCSRCNLSKGAKTPEEFAA